MPVTAAEIDAAVPPAGTPNRGLTNTALKGLIVDIANAVLGLGTPTVLDFASLPSAAANNGQFYWVRTSTGVWLVNRRVKGLYTSDGASWIYVGDFAQIAAEIGNTPAGNIAAINVQDAINELDTEKAPIASPTFTGTVGGITKAMVGLGSVDNTTDAGKPVSTAQATALAGKANTGSVIASGLTQATARFLGRITAAVGAIEELTATQLTAQLDAFTSANKGLVLASGGGTTNFLRADGSWVAPPGGGGSIAVPSDTRSGAYTLVAGNAQPRQRVDGNVTVPNTVFAAGDIVMLHSYSASLIDIIQGSGVTLRIGGSTVTGTCKLGPRGVAMLVFDTASDCTVQGAVM